jgi:hypothetical protein
MIISCNAVSAETQKLEAPYAALTNPTLLFTRTAGKLSLALELVRSLDRHDLTTPAGNLVKLLIEGAVRMHGGPGSGWLLGWRSYTFSLGRTSLMSIDKGPEWLSTACELS